MSAAAEVTNAAVSRLLDDKPEWAGNIILAGVRGSDSHGTKLPPGHPAHTDDTDTFGISVQPVDFYLGLRGYHGKSRQSWDTAGDHYDHLIHDVRKFFHLALKGNPNVLCWLFADPEDVAVLRPTGDAILAQRDAFLSRRVFRALGGYARAQMKKMDRKRYQGYQGAKRKKLVEEIGYDVKHAGHCIRLLTMGIELAETGSMHTRLPPPDAERIMEIKAGEWPFRKTERLAEDLFARFRSVEDAAPVPDEPDTEAMNDLMVEIIHEESTP